MATTDSTAPKKLSFTLLIDSPGCSYEKSSVALLYALQAWAKLIDLVNPDDPINDDALVHLYRAMQPALMLMTDELIGRINENGSLEDAVADMINLAAKKDAPHTS